MCVCVYASIQRSWEYARLVSRLLLKNVTWFIVVVGSCVFSQHPETQKSQLEKRAPVHGPSWTYYVYVK